ncbi:MAG: hypothetical protein KJS97_11235 [Alphaproteobacteria bacterium]|nr:hypothetical protein [Alphaproteobacteria bacterium]
MAAQDVPPNTQAAKDDAGGESSEHTIDGAIEGWLSTDVAETYDRMRADPERGIPLDAAFQRLRRARGQQRE